ncbi:hypothetical protein ACFE04_018608 [Oxalis oulophora]
MDGVELNALTINSSNLNDEEDLCEIIISRYSKSLQEDDQHLCSIIGAMSLGLKERNCPSSPVSYFGAATSTLQSLISTPTSDPKPSHVINSLMTIIALIMPRVSNTVLKKDGDFVKEIVLKVLSMSSVGDRAIVAGLQIVSRLFAVANKASWSDIADLYTALLGFITDSRVKVRKQSHLGLRDVLLSFRGMPSALASASDGILKTYERLLLLAGGSNPNVSDGGVKGAQEVLYVLDALKDCLPLMSTKHVNCILKYYKTLLELRQPLVTRRIVDSLNVLCVHPTLEFSAEALLDLLSAISVSVASSESSADSLTFAARLLNIGMTKIYSLDRQKCVVKIPVVFNALKDILTSEYEEAIFAATEAFKSLINTCIDENLIRQGVDQIRSANIDNKKSGLTIIEKACTTVESLLDYSHSAVWDVAFQVVSTMFDKLGDSTPYLMRGTLKNLEDMQKMSDDDFPYRKQLHECVGSALGAIGPETFLSLLPLNLEADDLADVNVWLFPILKHYTVGGQLSFFTETILGRIAWAKKKARKLELEGRLVSSRSIGALGYSLWSLLPAFCNYPLDTAESFNDLGKALCDALREEPEIRGIICSSLQILIQQNKKITEGETDHSDVDISIAKQRAMARYSPDVAKNNMDVLKFSARGFLTILSDIFLESTRDDGGLIQSTIGEFASIAREVASKLFNRKMRTLLKATQEAAKAENVRSSNSMQVDSSNENSASMLRGRLLDLSVSLLPGLNDEEIGVLFLAVKSALQDVDGHIQKKAYKVLSIILKNSESFLSNNLEELLQRMIDVMPLCHFSAKRHRLDCLYFLIVHVSKNDSEQKRREIISSFLTEIILALKEANKKTRNRAYDVLVQIGHACGDEENGGNRETLHQFFNMIAGGLVGETPHMISASVKGLARLSYEFSDLVSNAYQLLPSTYLLLQRKNREIIKASLGLLKVLVAKSQADGLQMHLSSMVEGLLRWQDDSKNHFKAKVKYLLEMLVKKCGMDSVKAVMPEQHMRLLTNIRKTNQRKEKKMSSTSEESKSHFSKATTSRLSRWNHTKIFSDFGDGETENSGSDYMDTETASGRRSRLQSKASSLRTKKTRKSDKNLPEDLYDQFDDEPLDLLDRNKTRLALRSSENNRKRKTDSDDEPEIDDEGRLIIREGRIPNKDKTSDSDIDKRSIAGSHMSSKSRSTQKSTQKRRKTSESGWAYTGNEYASKKAGGDLKKKGKLEPYAYWPLDRKMMSRRPEHQAVARKGMAQVVKMTKKLEGKSASAALSMKFPKAGKKGLKLRSKRKSK